MSTTSQPSAVVTVLRKQDGSRVPVSCPQAIISYNEFMGGVDRGDQLRGYYSCRTKSRKFYKYIFYFLLDVTITNAFVLYKDYAGSPRMKTIEISESSWRRSSLATTVVVAGLVVRGQFFEISLLATSR